MSSEQGRRIIEQITNNRVNKGRGRQGRHNPTGKKPVGGNQCPDGSCKGSCTGPPCGQQPPPWIA